MRRPQRPMGSRRYRRGWTNGLGGINACSLAREIAGLAPSVEGLKDALLRRFATATGAARQVIEQALATLGGAAAVMALVRDHVAQNRPLDGLRDMKRAAKPFFSASRWPAGRATPTSCVPSRKRSLRRKLFAIGAIFRVRRPPE